jgi:hypothetical protein
MGHEGTVPYLAGLHVFAPELMYWPAVLAGLGIGAAAKRERRRGLLSLIPISHKFRSDTDMERPSRRAVASRRRCLALGGELDTWCRNCGRRKHRTRARGRRARTPLLLCKPGKVSAAVIERP